MGAYGGGGAWFNIKKIFWGIGILIINVRIPILIGDSLKSPQLANSCQLVRNSVRKGPSLQYSMCTGGMWLVSCDGHIYYNGNPMGALRKK